MKAGGRGGYGSRTAGKRGLIPEAIFGSIRAPNVGWKRDMAYAFKDFEEIFGALKDNLYLAVFANSRNLGLKPLWKYKFKAYPGPFSSKEGRDGSVLW